MTEVEIIWDECGSALRSFIRKRVNDESIAEDILQDVFLKIQTHIGSLRDVRKIRYWLYQISRNAIIDYYRSRKVMVELPEALTSPEDAVADDVVEGLNPCIKSMVDELPPKYRQAVILTAYQGLTQKEMGEKLGLSPSGAKSRVQRAREMLKGMLLDCCTFEKDRLGKVIAYEPKS